MGAMNRWAIAARPYGTPLSAHLSISGDTLSILGPRLCWAVLSIKREKVTVPNGTDLSVLFLF
jgi:hypothetical protein